jgi:hypothetical protein
MKRRSVRARRRTSIASPTIAAKFADAQSARSAIEALENAGVDGGEIELLGSHVGAVSPGGDNEPSDRRAGRYISRRLALGAAAGALTGMLAGLALALVLLAVTDDVSRVGVLWACVIVSVGIGTTLGTFLGLERSVGFSESWPATFDDDAAGPLWVAVFTRDPTATARARHALQARDPVELRTGTS